MFSGAMLRFWAYRALSEFFSITLRIRPGQRLVTDGPYRFVRHPSYTGFLMFSTAIPFVFYRPDGPLACVSDVIPEEIKAVLRVLPVIMPIFMLMLRLPKEEVLLSNSFPSEWARYSRTTKRLVPGVF